VAEDPSALREAIEQTREEMAETVHALGEKLDVKSQANAKLHEAKQSALDKATVIADKMPEKVRPAAEVVSSKARVATGMLQRNPKLVMMAGVALVVLAVIRRRRKAD
jgi:hypothetical protein